MIFVDEQSPQSALAVANELAWPPCNLDSDEPPLESDLHRQQIDLLIRLLKSWWQDRQDFYISGNLTVYYNLQQLKSRDFRGPDVFVVLGAEKRDRRSWAIWEEDGKYPNVVIELLSSSTAKVDRGSKKILYQDVWRLPEYYWFDPHTLELAGFRLTDRGYAAIPPNEQGYLASQQLDLQLGIHGNQLRWFTAVGELIPLPEEIERQRADQERQAKEQAQQDLEVLKAFMRSQGIDPDALL